MERGAPSDAYGGWQDDRREDRHGDAMVDDATVGVTTEAGVDDGPRATAEVSLLLDVGSAWSKASVVGRARGRWRVVAHAAQPTAWGTPALLRTLAGHLRSGADQRVADDLATILAAAPRIACHTPARPGRIAIAAVTGEVSGDAARRAAESAGWVVAAQVAADDGRSLPDRLVALSGADADAWLIAGGFDSARPEQALEAAGLIAAARHGGRSPVIWAGSAALADEVAALFEPGVVTTVPNPRPSASEEALTPVRTYLEELLERFVQGGGTRNLAPIGFRRAVAEVAREERLCVGAVDLGARYATWVMADGRTEPVVPESRVYAAGGLGSPMLAAPGAPGRLVRMLAAPIDELVVADALQNMRSRPGTVPYSDEELFVTHAAGQLLLSAFADERRGAALDLLIGAGRLIAAAPTPMHALQLLLDGIRPAGITQLAVDTAGILGPLGSLADDELREGVGMLRDDLLTPLGTSVVLHGGRAGQPAMIARLHRTGWPDPEPTVVRSGHVVLLPLPRGERAELELELSAGVSLPGARRAHRVRAEVVGGTVGLVLDARGVPLQLPRRLDDRRVVLAGWRDLLLREPAGREHHEMTEQAPGSTEHAAGDGAPGGSGLRRLRSRVGFLARVRRTRAARERVRRQARSVAPPAEVAPGADDGPRAEENDGPERTTDVSIRDEPMAPASNATSDENPGDVAPGPTADEPAEGPTKRGGA